ncbi:hypothetical protein M407DRAFT_227571 [Tulasnella calospora MUT 4182]|uniref:Uncharacterized protein n=1 Tax=Tulasnella calospora MUT 4182 TaxID=1051891 RepID=A0A0C3M719_9AGAM|nr:hypothetical protein M407DRAFT_227571 [Tulasnella calospora MUT 4182]
MLKHVLARIKSVAGESTSQTHYDPILSPTDETQPRRSRSRHDRQNSTLSVHAIEDSGIKWAHYILGAACLLPWNAMITAMPYFLARLEGSSLQSAFPSYLSSIFNLAGFAALSYATATAKQANSSKRIRPSLTVLVASLLTLTVSPFTSWSPGTFFVFVLLNALFQASFGAYFQTALVRLASLFGPYAIQAFFTGQAAVGVAVSAVQFVAAALAGERRTSNDGPSNDVTLLDDEKDRMLREASTSAFWFFSLSTAFLLFTYATYLWLTKLPIYHEVVHPHLAPSTAVEENEEAEIEEAEEEERSDDEGAHPMSASMTESGQLLAVHVESQVKDADVSILGVAKLNLLYNIAVGYVFIVTLGFKALNFAILVLIRVEVVGPAALGVFQWHFQCNDSRVRADNRMMREFLKANKSRRMGIGQTAKSRRGSKHPTISGYGSSSSGWWRFSDDRSPGRVSRGRTQKGVTLSRLAGPNIPRSARATSPYYISEFSSMSANPPRRPSKQERPVDLENPIPE